MLKTASSLSRDNFKRMLAGNKSYLPKKISDELRSAGMGSLLYTPKVSRQKAVRALEHLEGKGMLPRYKRPGEIWRKAAINQYQQGLGEATAEKQKHIRANIAQDIIEEQIERERGGGTDKKYYPPGSILGQSLVDELKKEQETREAAGKKEQEKREKLINPPGAKPSKPPLANLPDMDIG